MHTKDILNFRRYLMTRKNKIIYIINSSELLISSFCWEKCIYFHAAHKNPTVKTESVKQEKKDKKNE